jgi:two-component system cell cycle sensor histidine kinase/response regulator CckA
MRRARSTRQGARRLAAALVLVAVAWVGPPCSAQSTREPIDLPQGDVVTVQGNVPFTDAPGPGCVMPSVDASDWGERAIPGVHGATGKSEGCYRISLRGQAGWPTDLAVEVPPAYGNWSLWFNGTLLGVGAPGTGGLAPERSRVLSVPPELIVDGANLLALTVRDFEGLSGLGGAVRLGPKAKLMSAAERANGVSLGLAMAFLLLGVMAVTLGLGDRDRLTVLVALTLLSLAAAGATLSDWWYVFFSDTKTKLHLRHALFYLMHAGGLFLVEQLFVGGPTRGTRIGAVIAVGLAGLSVVLPAGPLFALQAWSWVFTGVAVAYVIYLGRGLPLQSPVVRAGVRAGFAGLFVAVLFEAATGVWALPGVGPFELVFLALILSVTGLFVLIQARARGRALSVLRSSRDGLAVLDLFGRLVHANPALTRLLGGPVPDRSVLDARLSVEDRERLLALLARLAASPTSSEAESLVVRMKDGTGQELVIDVLGARLDDLHLLLALRDVTERSRLEKEVARAQRLDSLGMLAGGIAHDFNNLLAVILIAATELEQDEDAAPGFAQRAHSIAESARRGGALTSRLLQFARGRVSPTVGVELEGELPDMLDMLARTLGRNLEWSIDVEADLPAVAIDEAELEQILVNLCVNARDAMAPGGGRISVGAWTSRDPDREFVVLEIADDGPGMEPELLGRVIEPFVTTKGSGAGTGLGLAVVHGLVSARGGTMDISSEPGRGTRVTLRLPIQRSTTRGAERGSAARGPSLKGLSVLLVDDEPSIRTFLASALERRGLRVEVLTDGEAVLPWIAEHAGGRPPVDAVVMDMMMPVVDGLEASNALRAAWPGIPVVISSGYTGRESIEALLGSGPTLLLEKPYQVDDLLRALERVLA